MPVKCPHCGNSLEITIISKPQETLFITRKEYSEESLREDKVYDIIEYDPEKDGYKVTRRKK